MCVSTVWSVRLLGVWALNFFRWLGCWPLPGLGLGAAPLCTYRPGGCLRLWCSCCRLWMLAGWACAGDALPCGLLVLRPWLACAAVPPGCLLYRRWGCWLLRGGAAVWRGCSRSMPCSVKAKKRGSSLAAVPLWCLIIWVICGCVVPSGDFGYCYDNTGYN